MNGETTLAAKPSGAAIMERVLAVGDLRQLTAIERTQYYIAVCESVGLNPLTRPFEYIVIPNAQGGDTLILYARRDATEQLRKIHKVSLKVIDRRLENGVYSVLARAELPDGRCDESQGAVPLAKQDGQWMTSDRGKKFFQPAPGGKLIPLPPKEMANAYMTAETKAKRRVTLSICGLGFLDETELETIQGAKPFHDTLDNQPRVTTENAQPQLTAREEREIVLENAEAAGASPPAPPDSWFSKPPPGDRPDPLMDHDEFLMRAINVLRERGIDNTYIEDRMKLVAKKITGVPDINRINLQSRQNLLKNMARADRDQSDWGKPVDPADIAPAAEPETAGV